jgi:N-methylhydantoinase B
VHVQYDGGPPSTGSFNGTQAVVMATATIPFLYYIDPDIPHNHGVLKHVTADANEGTICKGKWPAAVGGATTNPADAMHDVINIAMAQAIPDLVPAGSCKAGHMPNFNGIDARNGREWGCMLFQSMGGGGAAKGTDGWPMIGTIAGMGGLTSGSIEEVELLYPLRIDFNEIEPDSMGMGQWIGGAGTRTCYRPIAGDMEAVGFGGGSRNPPHGVNGGRCARGGGIYIEHADGRRTYTSVAGQTLVRAGESWTAYSSGGGGWGRPIDRDPELVRRDLRDGIISERTAREIFGVVVADDLERTVDVAATTGLRASMESRERQLIDPTEPGASSWIHDHKRPGDRFLEAPTITRDFAAGGAA